jgi:hypothetical protein
MKQTIKTTVSITLELDVPVEIEAQAENLEDGPEYSLKSMDISEDTIMEKVKKEVEVSIDDNLVDFDKLLDEGGWQS